ncbi:lysozyme inhibitor LprI family protein [Solidesulfovibrio sp. C21]|uniref:lysozyme inhibitor LprI family protein n=1 Tax=Solidesulfovibrio sp. C21 TaxID=3398613 RepID=UPI0039FD854A
MRFFVVAFLFAVLAFSATGVRAQTQMEMNATDCDAAKKADAALNAAYAAILQKNKDDPVFIRKLKIAQRSWITFRDAELAARYPAEDKAMAYGSMYNLCYCNALAELTRKRTAELAPWRDGVPEGEGCEGSYPVR